MCTFLHNLGVRKTVQNLPSKAKFENKRWIYMTRRHLKNSTIFRDYYKQN